MRAIKFFYLICVIAILYISCAKDEPVTVTINASNYVGNYVGVETCENNINSTSVVQISSPSTTSSTIILGFVNKWGEGTKNVSASITGNSLSIPSQELTVGTDKLIIIGSGNLSGKTLTLAMTYKFSFAATPVKCTIDCTKN
ncbi:MAG: hypothetical protein WAU01_12600 [Saprospiraceae bacterium]